MHFCFKMKEQQMEEQILFLALKNYILSNSVVNSVGASNSYFRFFTKLNTDNIHITKRSHTIILCFILFSSSSQIINKNFTNWQQKKNESCRFGWRNHLFFPFQTSRKREENYQCCSCLSTSVILFMVKISRFLQSFTICRVGSKIC